ncbi:DUF4269 domain-containing protein [Chitinophaga nivalis]|uniref:DUF4269 domain-containing protein n=1 Tax=Chitinophaga nivalis TaxID=2991709 RepID=A0ABT3IK18_9BACT|nr:DUF4269 domain-containing protein [Chitinophaga nivalis]MCW3466001.1 DUF4269 domain-containing protein [Chitinophaga nivalis]MCW3484308.1 DUF4269 domain-containing protein [Chitinophaga nivalis]
MTDQFNTIHYLQTGTLRQQQAHAVLQQYQVMEKLQHFDPLLAGTIPIGVDIDDSDLDIICCYQEPQVFQTCLEQYFSGFDDFRLYTTVINDTTSIIAQLQMGGWPVEIFGQGVPSREQAAFRHMLIEYQLLQQHGEPLRQEVIRLKKQGYKTEPAFARVLGIPGDPYQALLQLTISPGY